MALFQLTGLKPCALCSWAFSQKEETRLGLFARLQRSLGHDREDSGLNNSGSGVTWSGVTGASPIIRRGRVFCSELVFHDFCFFRHGSIVQLLSRRFRCGVKASLSPG